MNITGLHHVTALAGNPQRNLHFYTEVLGLHLVKRTINFDDPGSYHFYFGDHTGTPGSILTFFPYPEARRGVRGTGEVAATAFTIPQGSEKHWRQHLTASGVAVGEPETRFGDPLLRFTDPDGLPLELVAAGAAERHPYAIQGLHSVAAALADATPTARLLTEVFGYTLTQHTEGRQRYTAPGAAPVGKHLDLLTHPSPRGSRAGAGTVHHIAFRVADAPAQAAWRAKLTALGFAVSPVRDRTYFESIYFREPGGVLFELATDGPGFAVDESAATLGHRLCLPAWLEPQRPQVEALLPELPTPATV